MNNFKVWHTQKHLYQNVLQKVHFKHTLLTRHTVKECVTSVFKSEKSFKYRLATTHIEH